MLHVKNWLHTDLFYIYIYLCMYGDLNIIYVQLNAAKIILLIHVYVYL